MFIYNIDDVIFMLFIIIACASLVILYLTYFVIRLYKWLQKRRKDASDKG